VNQAFLGKELPVHAPDEDDEDDEGLPPGYDAD
jgi:hypothetical protein